ncbi:class I SAM-dependent methyltransferase [Tunturiibacter psychrotolerans]|uniref:class I SAM-dependent methyltransferase n=2 Tax=Tunturiibacter psychrotolerans TaxID=3069686 RepID=UPI003D222D5C
MDKSTLLAPVARREPIANSESAVRERDQEQCPICGVADADLWAQGPDRLHGRTEEYTLLRCSACSLVWLSSPPRPEEMHLHYTEAYHKLISGAGDNSVKRWKGRKADLVQQKRSGALLDLGCSSGSFLESMRSESWKLYGIEMSPECAKAAEARCGAQVFVGNILDAPFPPESFDVITCFDVLEHLFEPRQVMEKVATWLKPGGIFFVQVPNIDSAEARAFGTYWHGLELPRHLFHYSPESLRFLAESTGLQQVALESRRNPAVGTSLRYVWDDAFRAVGIRRTPVAYRGQASLPWRAGRKLVRLTVLRFLLAVAPILGGGEAIHAIFRKGEPLEHEPSTSASKMHRLLKRRGSVNISRNPSLRMEPPKPSSLLD